jgi:hypothetical protein
METRKVRAVYKDHEFIATEQPQGGTGRDNVGHRWPAPPHSYLCDTGRRDGSSVDEVHVHKMLGDRQAQIEDGVPLPGRAMPPHSLQMTFAQF